MMIPIQLGIRLFAPGNYVPTRNCDSNHKFETNQNKDIVGYQRLTLRELKVFKV